MTQTEIAVAVDIGGTKLEVGLCDAAGTILLHRRAPTPPNASAEELFSVLESLITDVLGGLEDSQAKVSVCGVGCGGPMEQGGITVSPLNIPGWVRFPLKDRLEKLIGVPAFVDNDAKALALGEGWVGSGAGKLNFMAMVVSTGVGGGIVLDGRLLGGNQGNAGHVGHLIVEPNGRMCPCGARGCLEAETSGSAIAAITGRPAAEASSEVIARTGRLVGRAVASVASLLDLGNIYLAGSVALGFGEPFFAAANEELHQRSKLSFTKGATIEPGGLGPLGPVVGAGAVGWQGRGRQILGTPH